MLRAKKNIFKLIIKNEFLSDEEFVKFLIYNPNVGRDLEIQLTKREKTINQLKNYIRLSI